VDASAEDAIHCQHKGCETIWVSNSHLVYIFDVKLHCSSIWGVSGSTRMSGNRFARPARRAVGKGERWCVDDIMFPKMDACLITLAGSFSPSLTKNNFESWSLIQIPAPPRVQELRVCLLSNFILNVNSSMFSAFEVLPSLFFIRMNGLHWDSHAFLGLDLHQKARGFWH
jgi:hypothetical protein